MTHPFGFTTFVARHVDAAGVVRVDGWRLKAYDVRHGDAPVDEASFASGVELALRELPQPARAAGRPGLGVLVRHRGRTGDYVVVSWWERENELPTRVFVREGATWRPARDESFCVWDLEVLWHERCAYVETMLAPGVTAPDDAYLSRTFQRSP